MSSMTGSQDEPLGGCDVRRGVQPLTAVMALAALTPVLVVLPTVSVPLGAPVSPAAPKPVSGEMSGFPVTGVDPVALGGLAAGYGPAVLQARRPAALTAQRSAERFDLVALTWTGPAPTGTTMQVRVREGGGWTTWHELPAEDHGPDLGDEAAGSVRASEPLMTNGADGVQVRVDSDAGTLPAGLRAVLVDGERSAADAHPAPAQDPVPPASAAAAPLVAATGRPAIITRAQWGADERLVKEPPVVDSRVTKLFIHHTDTSNSYTRAQAYAQVRAVYTFHTKGRGWNDIGYNFLVDRYGRVFEGRRGSISAAVHGAHTGGFNTDAIGISVLGAFSGSKPTSAALRGVVNVAAWKMAEHFINPRGRTAAVSSGGSSTRYPAGKKVTLRTISGHRDVGYTECPGNKLYPYLPWIRSAVAARLKPGLSGTTLSRTAVSWAGTAITLTTTPATKQRYWVRVTPMCGGAFTAVASGRTAARISARWDLRGPDGNPVPPGVYRVSVISSSPVGSVTYRRDVEVLPTLSSPPSACRVTRAGWGDVYTSAVVAGRERYPSASSVVLVGSGATLNGLVAAPLAAAKGAPLLLTPTRALAPLVARDIASRGVRTAYIVGGTSTVSAGVVSQLRGLGVTSVVRLNGRNSYELAAAVARRTGAPSRAVVVASGTSLSDVAAVAGPAAAMKRPVLLVARGGVPAATGSALKALGVRTVLVVGGPSVVGPAVLTRLRGYGVTSTARVAGKDRASTAVAVATAFRRPVSARQVVVMPSSSAWAVVGAAQGRLTAFTDRSTLPAATARWLASRKPGRTMLVGDLRAGGTPVLSRVYSASR